MVHEGRQVNRLAIMFTVRSGTQALLLYPACRAALNFENYRAFVE